MTSLQPILIVDDSPKAAELLRRTLVRAGYAVSIAYNGEEGLQAARAQRPVLVMSDINMPLMDGYLAAAALRKLETAEHRFVLIAHSARATPPDLERARRAGFDHHIAKPARSGAIQSLVNASAGVVRRHD